MGRYPEESGWLRNRRKAGLTGVVAGVGDSEQPG